MWLGVVALLVADRGLLGVGRSARLRRLVRFGVLRVGPPDPGRRMLGTVSLAQCYLFVRGCDCRCYFQLVQIRGDFHSRRRSVSGVFAGRRRWCSTSWFLSLGLSAGQLVVIVAADGSPPSQFRVPETVIVGSWLTGVAVPTQSMLKALRCAVPSEVVVSEIVPSELTSAVTVGEAVIDQCTLVRVSPLLALLS